MSECIGMPLLLHVRVVYDTYVEFKSEDVSLAGCDALSWTGRHCGPSKHTWNILASQRSLTSWKIFVFGNAPVRTSFYREVELIYWWNSVCLNCREKPSRVSKYRIALANTWRL